MGYAEWYSDNYNFNFPTVPDVGNNWLPFMADGYPTHVIFDLETMEFLYKRSGMMSASEIRGKLDQYLQ